VEDYSYNILSSVGPSALVFSYQWDYWVAAAYYQQAVRGFRSDVIVIDKELLRRSWYVRQLQRMHPDLIAGSRREVDAFMVEVDKFENDRPYNPAVIEGRYAEMIKSFIDRTMAHSPVYVTDEIEPQYTKGYQRVPEGLTLRLYADSAFHPTSLPEFRYRELQREGRLESQTKSLYANAYINRARYYSVQNREEALRSLRIGLRYQPGNPVILDGIRAFEGKR
jgi:hypothetical protein